MTQARRAKAGDVRRAAAVNTVHPPLVELLRSARAGVAGVKRDLIAMQRRMTDPDRARR
jgi:hypothetical protein